MGALSAVLNREVSDKDLVLISPWFLHPSFQRYYRGGAAWATVPVLAHHPMMRYDLVKEAILQPEDSGGVQAKISAALERRGKIWLVSQRPWTSLNRMEAPEPPPVPRRPTGEDYIRYRSYWEREAEFRLRQGLVAETVEFGSSGRTWREEDLLLTRWSAVGP